MGVLSRRRALAGSGVAAGFLVAASAASACIPFFGQMTISDNDGFSTSQTVHGTQTYHGWCDPSGPPWTVRVTKGGTAHITVSVAPTTECGGGSSHQLSDGTNYELRTKKGEMLEGTSPGTNPCYQSDGSLANQTTLLASNITVSSGSAGPISGAWTTANQASKYAVCLSRSSVPAGSTNGGIGMNVYTL